MTSESNRHGLPNPDAPGFDIQHLINDIEQDRADQAYREQQAYATQDQMDAEFNEHQTEVVGIVRRFENVIPMPVTEDGLSFDDDIEQSPEIQGTIGCIWSIANMMGHLAEVDSDDERRHIVLVNADLILGGFEDETLRSAWLEVFRQLFDGDYEGGLFSEDPFMDIQEAHDEEHRRRVEANRAERLNLKKRLTMLLAIDKIVKATGKSEHDDALNLKKTLLELTITDTSQESRDKLLMRLDDLYLYAGRMGMTEEEVIDCISAAAQSYDLYEAEGLFDL